MTCLMIIVRASCVQTSRHDAAPLTTYICRRLFAAEEANEAGQPLVNLSHSIDSLLMGWQEQQSRCFFFATLLFLSLRCWRGTGFTFTAAPSFALLRRHSLHLTMQVSPRSHQPLYITIGPPCAGKTTLLHRLEERLKTPLQDVTLDDQQDVYVEVPVKYFLLNAPQEDKNDIFLQKRIQYKTLASRIYDNATNGELRAILQRIDGRLSPDEFESTIQTLYAQHANSTASNNTDYFRDMATLVLNTVHAICQTASEENSPISLPSHIQLFCVESLFRPHPNTNKTGVESAHDLLWEYGKLNATTTALAWGNTNTRPREYREALDVATVTKRPVYFIVYAQDNTNNILTTSGVCMPHVGLQELMRRNVMRMLSSGKFVPGRALVESHDRIATFMETALDNLQRRFPDKQENVFTKLELDQELARMVNYEMGADRMVRRMRVKTKKKRRPPPKQRRPPPQSAAAAVTRNNNNASR